MSNSLNLALPYLEAAQAQKHVTMNDALRRLDAVVQLAVEARTLTAPPPSPQEGDRYLVAGGATGAWEGHDLEVAAYADGAWVFFVPRPGWITFVQAEGAILYFTGAAWEILVSAGDFETVARFGVNGVGDAVNRLVVQSEAALFAPDPTLAVPTGDARIKVTKTAAGDVASHLFQTNYSGRAEFGLIGSDDFTLKVSPDGSTFVEAFTVDRQTARVAFASPPAVAGGGGFPFSVPSRAELAATTVPAEVSQVLTRGFSGAGDDGDARYRRVAAEPAHAGKVRSADGAWWELDVDAVAPEMLGARRDGETDDGAAITSAAAVAKAIGAVLRLRAGRYVLNGQNAPSVSVAVHDFGDASLRACVTLPYEVKVETAGTATELVCRNLGPTVCAVAIAEPMEAVGVHSQRRFFMGPLMIRADGGVGRYGIVTASGDALFSNKRPRYQFDHVHFCGGTDAKTVLQNPLEGWDVCLMVGDTVGVEGYVTAYGGYLATADPAGQHQCTAVKVSARRGAFGVNLKGIVWNFYTGFDYGDGVEGFSFTDSECAGCHTGFVSAPSGSEPGGFIDNVHVNTVREGYRFQNRSQVYLGNVEAYRADSFWSDGTTPWYGVRLIASTVHVGHIRVNSGDSFLGEANSAAFSGDAASRLVVDAYSARSVRRIAVLEGSLDSRIGEGDVTNVHTILALSNAARRIAGGDVIVRSGTVNHYFTTDGTVDRNLLHFPRTTLIAPRRFRRIELAAAGTLTVRPRLDADSYLLVMTPGAGPYTYDVVLDTASAVDGDVVEIKIAGSSSSNPTIHVHNASAAGSLLATFASIGGAARLVAKYVYSGDSGGWLEMYLIESAELSY